MLPYLDGEPTGFSASVARLLTRFFPPIGNVQSVGLDVALGKEVFPATDWWSVPIGLAWCLLFWGGALALFHRKDL